MGWLLLIGISFLGVAFFDCGGGYGMDGWVDGMEMV